MNRRKLRRAILKALEKLENNRAEYPDKEKFFEGVEQSILECWNLQSDHEVIAEAIIQEFENDSD